jgi:hypothetical protein
MQQIQFEKLIPQFAGYVDRFETSLPTASLSGWSLVKAEGRTAGVRGDYDVDERKVPNLRAYIRSPGFLQNEPPEVAR